MPTSFRPIRLLTRALLSLTAAAVLLSSGALPASAAVDTDRWTPPSAHHSDRFDTMDITWSDGTVTTAVWPAERLPVGLVVEQEVLDALGSERVRRGVGAWNGVAGSRFAAHVSGTARDGQRAPREDGVNRIFVDDTCQGEEAGWAHVQRIEGARSHLAAGGNLAEVDIGICPRSLSRPDHAVDTIIHEMGHLLGLGHQAASCRIMAARTDACQAFTKHDRDALRHLYPTMPRLAGPTRIETAARVSYATREGAEAETIVLADGFGTSVLPVTAAALAGAIDAPLVLARRGDCLAGVTGDELRRVATRQATVLVVGMESGCSEQVRRAGWTPVALNGVRDIAAEFARRREPDTIMVVRGPHADGNLPDGLTAAAAAGQLGAPILLADGAHLHADTRAFIDERRSLRRAIIVGGRRAVPASVADQLRDLGLRVDRHAGADRIGTALAIADIPGMFRRNAPTLVATAEGWADTVSGSALGGAQGWPVLLTPRGHLDGRVADRLSTVSGGYVLGGPAAIADVTHWRASAEVH